jgi:drug/metabolite transporter (DMT)-like permease
MADQAPLKAPEEEGEVDTENTSFKVHEVKEEEVKEEVKQSKWLNIWMGAVVFVVGVMLFVVALLKEESEKETIKSLLVTTMGITVVMAVFVLTYYIIAGRRSLRTFVLMFVFLALAVFVSILVFGHGDKVYKDMKDNSVILITGIVLAILGLVSLRFPIAPKA